MALNEDRVQIDGLAVVVRRLPQLATPLEDAGQAGVGHGTVGALQRALVDNDRVGKAALVAQNIRQMRQRHRVAFRAQDAQLRVCVCVCVDETEISI